MNRVKHIFSILFLASLAAVCVLWGATATTETTLSAAQGITDATVTLASSSGITAVGAVNAVNTGIVIDSEYEEILTLVSGNTWQVRRGQQGTPRQAHNTGAVVWAGPPNGPFPKGVPSGACPGYTGYQPVLPVGVPFAAAAIARAFGCISDQNGNPTWYGWPVLPPGTAASSSNMLAPGPFFHVTGAASVATITPPPGFVSGCLYIVPDSTTWSTTTGGNIALGTTPVVSKVLLECYDTVVGRWFPSY